MKFYLTIIILGLIGFSCKSPTPLKKTIEIESIQGPTPFTNLEINNAEDQFQFAIVTDRTGGHREGVFPDGINKLNLLQPEFVMSVGDLIEGYTEDETKLNAEWREFNGFIDHLEMPFFYVPGNHDITNKVMEDKWKELYGKTYYHFTYKNILFMCLNSEDNYRGAGRGTIDDAQYEWIKKTLEDNQEVKWTMVFLHQPLWVQNAETLRWNDVEALLDGRKHTVFAGHRHSYVKYERNSSKYFILATTGGGSRLRGPELGEFDHVVWVTMTENGPILANLALSGIWDEDVFTEPMANYFRPLVNGSPIKVEPIFVDDITFNKAIAKVKLTNDSDAPMHVLIKSISNEVLQTKSQPISVEVNPNSVEVLEVPILANGVEIDDLKSIHLESEVTFKGEGFPDLKVNLKQKIRPETKQNLNKVSRKKVVDGNLDDWVNLPFTQNEMFTISDPFSHAGNEDGSMRFGVEYDEKYVYIAASVIDDEILTNESSRPYNQDAFQIMIDARETSTSAQSNSLSGVLFVGISPLKEGVNKMPFSNAENPDEILGFAQVTNQGYQAEFAIPISYIEKQQGSDWRTIRFNAAINDYDENFNHSSTLLWKPDWRGTDNFAGSGMLFRVLH